ncbi:MAG: anaerobic glycerol-3-phosphate dehydrogenase subunit GlpA [Trueperella sp.]|nr:anaerobic glycerol-3-phosphate dehydrogenase subunit GlpA [Trueperella sp.]
MKNLTADVVVIGGGGTGAGILRDLAMRGYHTILVERADLAQGTSGRFHGLLHSGARYVVSDPISALECAEENQILRRIHPHAIEETGGLFVTAPPDSEEYADGFLTAAQKAGVFAEEIPVAAALQLEPRLNPGIKRAFSVLDGAMDGWRIVWDCVASAREYGSEALTYHRVTGIEARGDFDFTVTCLAEKTGEEVRIDARGVVNAAGPWAGEVATLAGCHGVDVVPGRGIMVAMNHRLTDRVINRCIYPGDGDILVPAHTVSIIGTTDKPAKSPDFLTIPDTEVQEMLDAGEVLIPGFRQSRAVHVWAGARPLIKDSRVSADDTRHMSRNMSVIDHGERDGVPGMFTIAGGKYTTYRLMAEKVVDTLLAAFGEHKPCRTAQEAMPSTAPSRTHRNSDRLAAREADRCEEQIICECELANRAMIAAVLAEQPTANLDDIRRRTRLGMGPCQGTFCAARAAGILYETTHDRLGETEAADRTSTMLRLFLRNRLGGVAPLLYGEQLHEAVLNQWVVSGTLDVDHLLAPGEAARLATGDIATIYGIPQPENTEAETTGDGQ